MASAIPLGPAARRARCHRGIGAVVAASLVAAVAAVAIAPAGAEASGPYAPPVERPVSEPFLAPAHPYAAGNRGLDYVTEPGDIVRASASGEVTFAGAVGGSMHVVVLHGDGIRTSYSFLADVTVRRGDPVGRGEPLGRAGSQLHFGARAGDRYLDPADLLGGGAPEVHLVPVHHRRVQSESSERSWLLRGLGAAWRGGMAMGGAGRDAARWAGVAAARAAAGAASSGAGALAATWAVAGPELADAVLRLATLSADLVEPLALASELVVVAARIQALIVDQQGCTPPGRAPPPPPGGRRIAVLVGGYGSAAGHAAVLDIDTASLGYADADRVQFSYAGGRAPGTGALTGVPVRSYSSRHSMVDIRRSATRLRQLLADIAVAQPGVPVDVFAHSQGGLVARAALAGGEAGHGSGLPAIGHVVTLGSPHAGTDLATVAARLRRATIGPLAGAAVRTASGGDVDPYAPSVVQMAERSAFITSLGRRRLPPTIRLTSIAADGDLVVPALNSSLPRATNVVVGLRGLHAHDALPGSDPAHREISLALGGAGPTCRTLLSLAGSGALAAGISAAEERGATALVAALPGP